MEVVPISKNIIEPKITTNIEYVNSIQEVEDLELEPCQTVLKFDNNKPCFYVRERDKFGEYVPTKIYFYQNFAEKMQNIEVEEFVKKCKEVGLDDLKTQIAVMFFVEKKKPLEVWEWSLKNTKKDWEWDYVRSLKHKLKLKLFTKVTE